MILQLGFVKRGWLYKAERGSDEDQGRRLFREGSRPKGGVELAARSGTHAPFILSFPFIFYSLTS